MHIYSTARESATAQEAYQSAEDAFRNSPTVDASKALAMHEKRMKVSAIAEEAWFFSPSLPVSTLQRARKAGGEAFKHACTICQAMRDSI